jgi:magnesium-transporting ATPase (P-type)
MNRSFDLYGGKIIDGTETSGDL